MAISKVVFRPIIVRVIPAAETVSLRGRLRCPDPERSRVARDDSARLPTVGSCFGRPPRQP